MTESFADWMLRQGRASADPYRPWGRAQAGSVMLHLIERVEPKHRRPMDGRLVPFASIEWIGYAGDAAAGGRIGHLVVVTHGLLIEVRGRVEGLLEAFQRGEVDFIQAFDAEAWPEDAADPPPREARRVDAITIRKRWKRP